MALDYDNLTAITQTKIIPKMVDNIFNSTPLFTRFKANARTEDGGEKILQPLMYAENTSGGSYKGYDALDTTPRKVITDAKYDWKQNYQNVSIDRLTELKNAGKSRIISVIESLMENARMSMQKRFTTQLFSDGTGNDDKDITGLLAAVDDATNIDEYGGITRSDYTWWKAEYTASGGAVTLALMKTWLGEVTDSAIKPDLTVTTQTLFDAIWGKIESNVRAQSADLMRYGFDSIVLNGVPIVVDAQCPSGYVFFLNTNFLHFVTHKEENFRFDGWRKPTAQNAKTSFIFWAGELTSSNCRFQNQIRGVTAS